ncbi:hypothetical protein DXA68_18275 [Bacteroides stercorirosoris]|uniref:Uncharacterized protein n=1 Tax=Bacteroides stercorirosoris TaxID=871324 RepID=A0A413H0F8_9BACE|nr:hypothetical protein DXA68_18275 [Bacteroides stercorirosoris]
MYFNKLQFYVLLKNISPEDLGMTVFSFNPSACNIGNYNIHQTQTWSYSDEFILFFDALA